MPARVGICGFTNKEAMMRGLERYWLKKHRTPAWADQSAINEMYRYSKLLGDKWHVDHIVPLFHPRVCGLHCEDNLQVITAAENLRKSNHYWPDMWNEQRHLALECCRVHQMKLL